MNEPTNQPINQPTNQSINQPTDQQTKQTHNKPTLRTRVLLPKILFAQLVIKFAACYSSRMFIAVFTRGCY
jgi:hypothetical protein